MDEEGGSLSTMETVRRATANDTAFLWETLLVAANWNPDRPRRTIADVMRDPTLTHYVEGWPRDGDAGVVADDHGPVGAIGPQLGVLTAARSPGLT